MASVYVGSRARPPYVYSADLQIHTGIWTPRAHFSHPIYLFGPRVKIIHRLSSPRRAAGRAHAAVTDRSNTLNLTDSVTAVTPECQRTSTPFTHFQSSTDRSSLAYCIPLNLLRSERILRETMCHQCWKQGQNCHSKTRFYWYFVFYLLSANARRQMSYSQCPVVGLLNELDAISLI